MENRIYHYFYKIINKINGHFYFGIHSTKNLNDGYMGSGTRLRKAYKKYGIESFEKYIIKFFDTREYASEYESKIVNEYMINNNDCYNIRLGGDDIFTLGTVTVRNSNGDILQISQKEFDDNLDKYVGVTYGTISVTDIDTGKSNRITVDEYYNNKHKYETFTCGKICVVDNNGRHCWVTTDEYYIDKNNIHGSKYKHIHSNKVLVKNKNGDCFCINRDDNRIESGELTLFWVGRKHKQETKEKQKQTLKRINHQKGEKNSQFGTCWITKDGLNKKIKKDELSLYELQGWHKGRVIKYNK